jgi:F-type H+-transporting ATPase subunit epsilon
MAATQFELVTPSRTLYSGQAEMIVCRTVDGEIAFLANHMPYIGALDTCVVRIVGPGADDSETSGEADVRVAVLGGFVEVKDNQVIMLADVAEPASEVDVEQARRDETAANERVSSSADDENAMAAAEADLRWAQVRLEVAEGVASVSR